MEFLQTRSRKTLLRSIDESNGQWVYTKAGLKYFGAHEFHEYIVHIPVEIECVDGRQRGRKRVEMLPWSKFGGNIMQSQLGTQAERNAQVIQRVKDGLGVARQGDVVMEISNEVYRLNEDRAQWGLTEMRTPATAQGVPQTTVSSRSLAAPPMRRSQLDVPLGHRGQASHLPFPDDLLEEAFEQRDDRLCVPRQLCRLLGYTFDHVCRDLDVFLGPNERHFSADRSVCSEIPFASWRDVGVTSRQIMAFLQDKGIPYHCFADEEHHIWTCAEPQHPGVAWTVHDGHCWM
jgi:hypothetical protein